MIKGILEAPKTEFKITTSLVNRVKTKDTLIKNEFSKCPYKVGDIVFFNVDDEKDIRYHQSVKVLGIASDLFTFGKAAWSEPPRIVTAKNLATNETFFCTVNYLIKEQGCTNAKC